MKVNSGNVTLDVGDVVTIRSGMTNDYVITTGNIERVSKTQVRVDVRLANGRKATFYHNKNSHRYVNNPGAGIGGSFLNDYFNPHEACNP